jgi:CheY-like chemotaxis protein
MAGRRRVQLFHWHEQEAAERAARLRAAGYIVLPHLPGAGGDLQRFTNPPPDAIVIDLSRLPSHGRDVAVFYRATKRTRHIPLIFVEGEPEKVAKVRTLLPDATYTTWGRIRSALRSAIARPPEKPVTPASALAGYSGTPLPKKLGIKPGARLALVGAPEGFERVLGPLPEGAGLSRRLTPAADLAIWFVRSLKELRGGVRKMAAATPRDGLWIAWAKQASGVPTDVTQAAVREAGLSHGIVDYKICAIDPTWSGLKFARRKT